MAKSSAEMLLAKRTYSANDVEKLIKINTRELIEENQKLKNEIKELNETIDLLEKKTLKAKSENMKIKMENFDLKENTAPKTYSHNARGAGRKPKITDEQITLILMYRSQGKKLKDIATELNLSYGSVQNISKKYTRLEDIPKVN